MCFLIFASFLNRNLSCLFTGCEDARVKTDTKHRFGKRETTTIALPTWDELKLWTPGEWTFISNTDACVRLFVCTELFVFLE